MAEPTSLPRSRALFERAQGPLSGGVSRGTVLLDPHPIYAAHGKGAVVTDVDGVERIDFVNNMASLVHGHAWQPMVEAVTAQLSRGTCFAFGTEAEIAYAEELTARSPGFEKVRFVNSGSEAVMAAMKAARAVTGRPKIAKVEGAYHGAYDFAEVSQAPDPQSWGPANRPSGVGLAKGTPRGVVDDVVVIPFNDPETAVEILDAQADRIAGIIVDPLPHRLGFLPADTGFMQALDAWAKANGALFIVDEVITFRLELGGAQQRYGVTPDLTTMAKMIGGGFPVGAVAGSDRAMSVFRKTDEGLRLPHSGTFSANPVTMVAGRVAMQHYDAEACAALNALGEAAMDQLREAIAVSGAEASVTGAGSLFRIHFRAEPPRNYRDSWTSPAENARISRFLRLMLEEGCLLTQTNAMILSTAMGRAEIDRLAEATLTCLRRLDAEMPAGVEA